MNTVGKKEIRTQKNVIAFFKEGLGYNYLGNWHHRQDNSNIEKERLTDWLKRQGHSEQIISRALFYLNRAATLAGSQTLYGANREVYNLLRYGVRVQPSGEFFVFVDECHRTQSGKLHKAMKTLLPEAVFIGFTGTPLLKSDKPLSLETFSQYIHTYKYDEAVADKVVLDLRYEARDIDQQVTSQRRLDQLFELKTQGLTDLAKAQLKKRWGTMRRVFSSTDRLNKIVADIEFDMERSPRLKSGRGNAMLVSDSIYSACRLFELFQRTELAGKCAIVTSYKPTLNSIKGEETGEGLTERLLKNEIYRKMLAAHFNQSEGENGGRIGIRSTAHRWRMRVGGID